MDHAYLRYRKCIAATENHMVHAYSRYRIYIAATETYMVECLNISRLLKNI